MLYEVITQVCAILFHYNTRKSVTLEVTVITSYSIHYTKLYEVFATTNNAALNQQIATDCKQSGILCNVADDNEAGDFVMQSSASSGGLEISVGTGGQLPWLARHLREAIERRLKTPEIGKLMHEMIEIRREVVAKPLTVAEKRSELQLRLLPLAKATESLLLSAEIEIKQ